MHAPDADSTHQRGKVRVHASKHIELRCLLVVVLLLSFLLVVLVVALVVVVVALLLSRARHRGGAHPPRGGRHRLVRGPSRERVGWHLCLCCQHRRCRSRRSRRSRRRRRRSRRRSRLRMTLSRLRSGGHRRQRQLLSCDGARDLGNLSIPVLLRAHHHLRRRGHRLLGRAPPPP